MQKCVEFIKNGNAIWLAPTATRQRTVFKTMACYNGTEAIEPQTMTFLTIALRRARIKDATFVAVGVVPDGGFKRGLNLFNHYKLGVGDSISMETAVEMARNQCKECSGSMFEFNFLHRIASKVVELGGAELLAPDKF
jgi:hypothetical protein